MRAEFAGASRDGAHQLLAAAVTLFSRMHGDQGEPHRDVVAEPLRLQRRRAALVADDLVVVAEAEVRELVGSEMLLGHRGFTQRGERLGTRAHGSVRVAARCSSRNAR